MVDYHINHDAHRKFDFDSFVSHCKLDPKPIERVPPAVHDGGLAIGAALYVNHNVFGGQRTNMPWNDARLAYLGLPPKNDDISRGIELAQIELCQVDCAAIMDDLALRLSQDQIVAWFEGRSEIGPRALGHRSILANPTFAENWKRVNHVKSRELWRPFAPAILAEKFSEWFEGCPPISPFMLFTAKVKRKQIPAVTHIDGTARVQTVDEHCGSFRRLLEAFYRITNVPVLMNTSFNGPGEPIVETAEQAIRFFRNSKMDALYLNGKLFVHRR
jgi:carbamoyltransferase